jgi:hypothetical protein
MPNYKVSYDINNNGIPMVGIITEEQALELFGQPFDEYGSLFSPVQDFYDRWVISEIEIVYNTNTNFAWVNSLPLVEWVAKIEVPWW